VAFKDLSQINENILTSSSLTGDIELRSPAGISLYPDSDNSGDDKIVWLRDGARLVFEGPIADPREIKIQAPEPTGVTEDSVLTLPSITGTFALLSDVIDSESALTDYIDARDAATLISANTYTDDRETAITIAYQTYTDTAEADAVISANAYTDDRETAITTAYQTYTDTAEADAVISANAYTDAAVSSGTGSLTTNDIPEASNLYYTDLRVQTYLTDNNYTTEAYVDQAEADAIATASADATSKANTAETSANAYTDTRETAITSAYQTYTDTAESDAISTANAYTDTRETAITSAYQTYTDTAESDAIATANSYTDTQVTKTVIDALGIQASSVDTDSVALGTDTTGNYVAGVSGTLNEIEVSGSGSETASVTVGLPANVSVTNDLTVGGDLFVTGTTVSIGAANLSVDDSFIYLNQGDAIGADNTVFTGTGLDDASFEGYYEGTTTTTYYVRIDGTGATDTFEWSKDNFATTEATGIAITGGEQDLDNNIKFQATSTTGHTLGDIWSGTAAPLAVDTGIFSNINTGTAAPGYTHVGVFYDASATRWKVFSEYAPEPNGDINTGDASFVLGAMEADCFIAREVDLTQAPVDNSHATTKLYVDNADTAVAAAATAANASLQSTLQANIDTKLNATANAVSASKWDTARIITLGGDASGNVSIDGSQNVTLSVTVLDDSHNHTIANVDGLQTALDAKVDDSQVLTDVPSGAVFTDTVYTHPTSHPISFITGLQTALDGKLSSTANAVSASKWDTARTITLGGDLSGNVSVDGSQNVTLNAEVTNDSHTHDGRYYTESESDSRFINTDGDTMTGTLTIGTVAGTAGTLNVTGNIVATGDVTAFSDRRFKHNVVQIDNALEKVKALRGVSFEKDNRMSIGVIAQEVEDVIPEVVHTNDEGLKSVAYGNIVGVLIEAIKEQNLKIEELKQEIDKLNGKI